MIELAVILAAGRGSRLDGGQTQHFSKPLLRLGERSLLARNVVGLLQVGVERVLVVTGFRRDLVGRELAQLGVSGVSTVHNPRWEQPNGVSLLACAREVRRPFLLAMADHLFDPELFAEMRAVEPPPGGAVLAIDRDIEGVFDLDDATKVVTDGPRITEIGKELTRFDAVDCGLFCCTPAIFGELRAAEREQGPPSLSVGMKRLARDGRFLWRDIGDRRWQDVDTPEMLAHARSLVE